MTGPTRASTLLGLRLTLVLVLAGSSAASELDPQLFAACLSADQPAVVALLARGADVRSADNEGNTALLLVAKQRCPATAASCASDRVAIAELLLRHGADVAAKNRSGQNASSLAFLGGNASLVRFLSEHGAEPGTTLYLAMQEAVRKRDEEEVQRLLDLGAWRQVPFGEASPLYFATHGGCVTGVARVMATAGIPILGKDGYGQTALMWTATCGEEAFSEVLARALPLGLLNAVADQTRRTALHWAAMWAMGRNIRLLLAAGAEVDARSHDGSTPLHMVARFRAQPRPPESDPVEAARVLLDAGARVEAEDNSGSTPLLLWAEQGYPELGKLLVSRGANPDKAAPGGDFPLHRLASEGHTEAVRILCDHGANPDQKTPLGTPLVEAITRNHPETALALIGCGADVNLSGRSGVMPLTAAAGRDYEVTKRLIEKGAKPNPAGADRTPLFEAVVRNKPDIAELLLAAGADPDAGTKRAVTPLHWAAGFGYPRIAALLLEHRARVDALDDNGTTPLLEAARARTATEEAAAETVERLLAAGAAPNHQDKKGHTPLLEAAGVGRARIVEILLRAGANPLLAATDAGRMAPLHAAARSGRPEVVAKLLAAGAVVDARDGEGRTPLIEIVRTDRGADGTAVEIVRELLRSGADRRAADRSGNTAADIARLSGQKALLAELEQGSP